LHHGAQLSSARLNGNGLRWITVVVVLFFIALQMHEISSSEGRVRSIIFSLGNTMVMLAIASGALPGGKSDGIGRTGKIFMVAGIAIMALAMMFVDGRLRIALI